VTIYTLRVMLVQTPFDEGDGTWRTIEIKGSQTLDQLHRAIFRAFGRWDEHLYSFFLSRDRRDASREYASPYFFEEDDFALGARPHNARHTKIDQLSLRSRQTFNYVFDYGDDWEHMITVLRIREEAGAGRYPKVVERYGDSPAQYPPLPGDEYEDEDLENFEAGPAKIIHLFEPRG